MVIEKSKKGISAVIATVLLIVIAIGLFVIIYFWINSMQQETILKFNSDIKQSCLNVDFSVICSAGSVQVQNNGDVPIWRADIYLISDGSSRKFQNGIQGPIGSGESASIDGITSTKVKVVPALLGISKKTGTEKEYLCVDKAKTVSCQ